MVELFAKSRKPVAWRHMDIFCTVQSRGTERQIQLAPDGDRSNEIVVNTQNATEIAAANRAVMQFPGDNFLNFNVFNYSETVQVPFFG